MVMAFQCSFQSGKKKKKIQGEYGAGGKRAI
jgi:hypothetical protein